MRARWIGIGVAAMALAAGACREDSQGGGEDLRPTVAELPATRNRDLDLLFVIDDSTGLIAAQERLKISFPIFLEHLGAVPGGLPNLHLGVVTSDMGTKASGSPTPAPSIGQIGQGGCSGFGKGGALQTNAAVTDLSGKFLIDVEQAGGGRMTNYTGSLPIVFAEMISAGAGGCGFEQPLAAMRAALDNHPSNVGFLRPDAMLGVVFLQDEDDCSAASPRLFDPNAAELGPLQSFRCTRFGVACAEGGQTPDAMNEVGAKGGCGSNPTSDIIDDVALFRDFLLGLKPDPRRVIVGGILGPAAPVAVELRSPPGGGSLQPGLTHVCSFMGQVGIEVADPAPRMEAFRAGFPDRSAAATICQADYTDGVTRLGELFRRSMGSACVEAPLADLDPAAPGAQVDCLVEDVLGAAATEIAACAADAAARPCWRLEESPASCPFSPAPGLALVVDRDFAPDPTTITRMRCAVAP